MSLTMHPPSGKEESLVQVKIHSDEVTILAACYNTEILAIHTRKIMVFIREDLRKRSFSVRNTITQI